jgi:hypothetical protein
MRAFLLSFPPGYGIISAVQSRTEAEQEHRILP